MYFKESESVCFCVFIQLANPDSVEGLVLINIDTNARGWIDWAAQKVLVLHFMRVVFYNPFSPGTSSASLNYTVDRKSHHRCMVFVLK